MKFHQVANETVENSINLIGAKQKNARIEKGWTHKQPKEQAEIIGQAQPTS